MGQRAMAETISLPNFLQQLEERARLQAWLQRSWADTSDVFKYIEHFRNRTRCSAYAGGMNAEVFEQRV